MFQHILLDMCGASPISPGRLVKSSIAGCQGPYHNLHCAFQCWSEELLLLM